MPKIANKINGVNEINFLKNILAFFLRNFSMVNITNSVIYTFPRSIESKTKSGVIY